MPFSIQCSNKGCGQIQNPTLDKTTDKVYCSICDKEIQNVTIFAKMQMKSLGQFKKSKQKSFSVKCSKCSVEDRPVKENLQYYCKSCKQELNIPKSFQLILDKFLSGSDKEA